jgi:PTS system beta-glucosides-specific IIC component
MKYRALVENIIEGIGGITNIESVSHCVTRLRFKLKDEDAAQTTMLEASAGVLAVIQSGGQYQVVVGNDVEHIYEELRTFMQHDDAIAEGPSVADTKRKERPLAQLFILINTVFAPTLGVLAGAGMIKGFAVLFTSIGLLSRDSGTFQLLNTIGDALFYFFPIFLGKNAMQQFGGNETLGMVLGAILVHPNIGGMMQGEPLYTLFQGSVLESPVYIEFLGLPVILMNYSSSVIPVLAACGLAAPLERWFKIHLHSSVRSMLSPCLTLLIVAPLTLLVVGVIATWLATLLGQAVFQLYSLNPIIAGLLIGGFWQLLIIFGLHWGFTPLYYLNFATLGYDPVFILTFATTFGQIGSVLGVVLKSKDKSLKTQAFSTFLTGLCGITEPAMYGVTLPRKKTFAYGCIGSALGGAILGGFGSATYFPGGLAIFGLPSKINPITGIGWDFYGVIIGIVVAFLTALVLTLVATKQSDIDLS